jgi:integrase/recombinase XerD
LPVALTDEQVRSLLRRVRNPTHKSCFAVMYACGLRIGEAATLEVGAIDKAHQVLRVIGKGNTERHVPLPQPVLDDLRKVWKTHRNPKWVFPNRAGTAPVERGVLLRTFAQVVQDAGLKGTATSHTLRHSYATRLMENGVDTRVVQILLGHASIATTTVYTHLTEPTRAKLRAILDPLMTGL